MNLLTNNRFNNVVKALMLCCIIALTAICFTTYKASLGGFVIFFLFFLFYVQLPGAFILRMLRVKFDHISTTLCAGLFTGWAFTVAVYFISEILNTNILLYGAGPLLSVLFIIAKYLNRTCDPKVQLNFSKLSTALLIFLALALAYSLLNNQYVYLSPEVSNYTYMNPDKGYHLGLIDSLSHGWPMICPWIKGKVIYYHIFTELLYSVPLRLFGLPADLIMFTCGPFMTVYAFSVALYSLFIEMTSRKNRAGLYCLSLMLSNIFIAKGSDNSLAFFFVFRNENAVGYGIACAMMVIVMLKCWYTKYSNGESCIREFIILTAFIMLLTGIKGPMALVIIGALWGTFLLGLILRKLSFKTILPLIILTVGFLIIYVVVLGSKGQTNGGGNSIIAFATIASITFYKAPLVAFMKGIGIPKMLRLLILLTVFAVFTLTAFVLPFSIGYIRELILVFSGKRIYDFTRITVYAACLVGFIAMLIMNYSGHSQVYFGYVGVFLTPLVSFWFFEDLESNKGLLMNVLRGLFIACLIITSFTLFSHIKLMAQDASLFAKDTIEYSPYECISHDEYEAMKWIRENTPADALLATDRYYSDSLDQYSVKNRWNNRFFLYADYANRFCYLAGSGYNMPADDWQLRQDMIYINNQLYSPTYDGRGQLARNLGIGYVVVSKKFTGNINLENDDYTICFSNDDVDVYKIKGGN